MNDIICPHCNKAFKVDETGYADILKQVRDSEFEKQLHERLELAEKEKRSAVELAKERTISEMQKASSVKDVEIQELKARLDATEVTQKLAVTEAVNAIVKERDELRNGLKEAELKKRFTDQEIVQDPRGARLSQESSFQRLL